jgi:hypothetical protein
MRIGEPDSIETIRMIDFDKVDGAKGSVGVMDVIENAV